MVGYAQIVENFITIPKKRESSGIKLTSVVFIKFILSLYRDDVKYENEKTKFSLYVSRVRLH